MTEPGAGSDLGAIATSAVRTPAGWRLDGAKAWITNAAEAGVGLWPEAQIVQLLRTGAAQQGVASGPMAEVVFHGTQYLTEADAAAMAAYLKGLPQQPAARPDAPPNAAPSRLATAGAKLYEQHCAACHGAGG